MCLQEVAIVLLDVGPLMSPIRDFASKAVCGFLQSKVHTKCGSSASLQRVQEANRNVLCRC